MPGSNLMTEPMATRDDDEEAVPDLAKVRRIEALGFRAWPAASSLYDGSWLVRLTAGHPSRRLNSVNPLDRMDVGDLDARIARLAGRFAAYDKPLVFRQTPLSPPALAAWLDGQGWTREGETLVMVGETDTLSATEAVDRLPLQDVGRFVEALLEVRGRDRATKGGLTELIGSIRPAKAMFVAAHVSEPRGERRAPAQPAPVATALCVRDGDYAGVFEVAVRPEERRRGHARSVMGSALRWARAGGADRAWLQVETDNAPALSLYRALGFREAYRYHYRVPPGEGGEGLEDELL